MQSDTSYMPMHTKDLALFAACLALCVSPSASTQGAVSQNCVLCLASRLLVL